MGIYKLRTDFATHLKVLLWIVLVIFVVGAIWSFGAAPFLKKQKQKEAVILVGEAKIQRNDYDAEWERIYKIAQQNGIKSPLEFARIKQMIIENMINSQKLIMVAEEDGIIITKKDIKKAKENKILEVLKQNRNAIMGDLDESEEALDPRKDKAFLKTLSENGMTIDSIISDADANVSDLSVKAELVQKQISDKIEANVKIMTNEDVKNSYKTFKVDQIVISEEKTTLDEAKANADKAYKELQDGADFNTVKNKYSKAKSLPAMDYNQIDSPWFIPANVGEAVTKLSVNKYTEPIEANKAYYICKVVSIENKVPAKLDKKAIDERKEMIIQSKQQLILSEMNEKMEKIDKIDVRDPEFNGFYHCILAEKAMTPANKKGEYEKAIECFTEALKKEEQLGKDVIYAKMAQVYFDMESYKECSETLYNMLDGKESTTEAYDLRALYGDALAKLGEKDKAVEQYKTAALLNKQDPVFQDELAMKFKEVGDNADAAQATAKANELRAFQQKEIMKQEEANAKKDKN